MSNKEFFSSINIDMPLYLKPEFHPVIHNQTRPFQANASQMYSSILISWMAQFFKFLVIWSKTTGVSL